MLALVLFERAAIVILLAYILMNNDYLKHMLLNRRQTKSVIGLSLIFSAFAILSNITGVLISFDQLSFYPLFGQLTDEVVIANTRVLSIGVSGIVGGPLVGTMVGVLSGIFRYFQGGTDPHIYLISSILIGSIGGAFGHASIKKQTYLTPFQGAGVAVLLELVQMACIYFLSSNRAMGANLVQVIMFPMMLVNSVGMSIFLSIILNTIRHEEGLRAIQTQDVLQLTKETLPLFGSGLNPENAQKAAELIHKTMKVSAVSITNRKDILAFTGAGSDHHRVGSDLVTDLSRQAITEGEMLVAHTRAEIGCHCETCPLEGAIVLPLNDGNDIVGTLKYYFTDDDQLTEVEQKWAEGLSEIFSTQIQLGKVDSQKHLLKQAELRTLQGQVNPHFFFNTINTISAVMRFDPDKARRLLIKLSQYFRANLTGNRQTLVQVTNELEQVRAYLEIEEARFPDKFEISFDISETLHHVLIPSFLMQVLVENAIHHAFKERETDNKIHIALKPQGENLIFSVEDNGYGIPESIIEKLGREVVESEEGSGTALENLNKRLVGIYGTKSELQIESSSDGTKVSALIPYLSEEEKINHENSFS